MHASAEPARRTRLRHPRFNPSTPLAKELAMLRHGAPTEMILKSAFGEGPDGIAWQHAMHELLTRGRIRDSVLDAVPLRDSNAPAARALLHLVLQLFNDLERRRNGMVVVRSQGHRTLALRLGLSVRTVSAYAALLHVAGLFTFVAPPRHVAYGTWAVRRMLPERIMARLRGARPSEPMVPFTDEDRAALEAMVTALAGSESS
jgi:hypothetical protein